MSKQTISHDEVLEIARQSPEFILEERRIKPFLSLANQIYKLRKANNLSQQQLAEKSGSSQKRISMIESGDLNPSLKTIIEIAEALGCQVSIELVECEDARVEALDHTAFFQHCA